MRLYLLRHGIAVERSSWSGSDEDRPLTAKGSIRVARVAKALVDRGLTPLLVLSSPYQRARQTAEIMAQHLPMSAALRTDQRLAPGFGLDQVTSLLLESADLASLMLVGHEPDLGELIGTMIGGARIQVKKAAIACLAVLPAKPTEATLLWFATPKLLG